MQIINELELARIDPNFYLNPFHVPQEAIMGHIYQELDNSQPLRPLPIQAPFHQHLAQTEASYLAQVADKSAYHASMGG
jgi:hypothetical protein